MTSDGGGMSFAVTAVHSPSKGLGRTELEGQGMEEALLIPQDGVLVVELQVLY